jgi:uncharacterized membrane protein
MTFRSRRSIRAACVVSAALTAGLAAGLGVAACSPDFPLPPEALTAARERDCNSLTYENFGADFMARYCLPCHNETLTDDLARSDAPTAINFNTLFGIREFQKRIRLRAGEQGDMPPRLLFWIEHPSEEERINLIRWLDCGAPAQADLEAAP